MTMLYNNNVIVMLLVSRTGQNNPKSVNFAFFFLRRTCVSRRFASKNSCFPCSSSMSMSTSRFFRLGAPAPPGFRVTGVLLAEPGFRLGIGLMPAFCSIRFFSGPSWRGSSDEWFISSSPSSPSAFSESACSSRARFFALTTGSSIYLGFGFGVRLPVDECNGFLGEFRALLQLISD